MPPDGPGVYVVQMLNETPISVNADRPEIAGRCIQVSRENVKFGRAKSLIRREGDYARTFGEGNFRFVHWVETEQYCELEAAVAKRLHRHRIAGLTGRMNEWLAGISVDEVVAVVMQEFARLPLVSKAVEDLMKIPMFLSSRTSRNDPARSSTLFAADVVKAAIYLRDHGMDQRLLAMMHHRQSQPETYASTIRYFGLHTELRGKNVSYAGRLAFVAQRHRQAHQTALASGGLPFEELVEQALDAFPME